MTTKQKCPRCKKDTSGSGYILCDLCREYMKYWMRRRNLKKKISKLAISHGVSYDKMSKTIKQMRKVFPDLKPKQALRVIFKILSGKHKQIS